MVSSVISISTSLPLTPLFEMSHLRTTIELDDFRASPFKMPTAAYKLREPAYPISLVNIRSRRV